ncbi:hypothetical protein, partial [Mesorhizobium sp. M7A.T.Ca.US.000.02.2.1]|uniref:hypothetical protein n=1 Tax=Mesorhizobium sp. M7A.T.Ca.US.000.02.2.1 TaxID=2496793 RepID=UPI000FD46228
MPARKEAASREGFKICNAVGFKPQTIDGSITFDKFTRAIHPRARREPPQMPKPSQIKHVTWRDGRPRFTPGPELRDAGYASTDLRWPDPAPEGWA